MEPLDFVLSLLIFLIGVQGAPRIIFEPLPLDFSSFAPEISMMSPRFSN